MNKILKTVVILNLLCLSVHAEQILTKDVVDLNNQHWAYSDVSKVVDKYKLIGCFADHTFRGEQDVSRYELSAVTLKLIKYIENSKKISLKTISDDFPADKFDKFSDISKNDPNFNVVAELKDSYNIVLLPPYEKTFSGKTNVNRNEIAYSINKVIELYTNKGSMNNPYAYVNKTVKIEVPDKNNWYVSSVKNVCDNKIMSIDNKNDFNGNENINRYQLANTLNKTIDYVTSLKY